MSGFCSRRRAEDLIKESRVKVNDEIVELGTKCLESDIIKIDNKEIKVNQDLKYYILNKKFGFVCSKFDKFNKKTIYDLISVDDNSLFSVGRLDKNTTGLIIITNDGNFAQRIIHPVNKIEKKYIVRLDKDLSQDNRNKLEKGIVLDGYKLNPCKIKNMSKNCFKVIISEGRKRQIRRMFEEVGLKVIKLHRYKIGNLDLGNLKEGQYKQVDLKFLEKNIFEK